MINLSGNVDPNGSFIIAPDGTIGVASMDASDGPGPFLYAVKSPADVNFAFTGNVLKALTTTVPAIGHGANITIFTKAGMQSKLINVSRPRATAPGPTPPPPPPPPPGPVPPPPTLPPLPMGALDPLVHSIAVTNVSPADVLNYPCYFQTVFKDGEVKDTPMIVGLASQFTVLTRHASGFVKRAMCHTVIPRLVKNVAEAFTYANTTAAQAAGPVVDPSDLQAKIVLTRGAVVKVADAQAMFNAGASVKVYDGPVATTFLIRDDSAARVYDLGFDQYRSVRPAFLATKWHGLGKWEVVAHGLNALGGALEDVVCDQIDITIGTATRTEANFVSYWGTWFAHSDWIGGAPEEMVNFDHNIGWLANQALALGAPYDPAFSVLWTEQVITNKYKAWQNAGKHFNDPGLWPSMHDAEPGTEPSFHLDYLFSRGDWRMRKAMMDQAYRSGVFRINFINGDPALFLDEAKTVKALGKPPTIFSNPLEQLLHASAGSPFLPHDEGIPHATLGDNWQAAHEPNTCAIPYLLTGNTLLQEAMQRWAMCDQMTAPVNATPTKIPFYPSQLRANGIGGYYGSTRGAAWSLNVLTSSEYGSNDGDPIKAYLGVIIKARLGVDFGLRGYVSPEYGTTAAYQYGVLARNSTKGGPQKFSPVGWWQSVNIGGVGNAQFVRHGATWAHEPFQNWYMGVVDGKALEYGYPVQVEIDAISTPIKMFVAETQVDPVAVNPHWFGTYVEPFATAIALNPAAPLYTTIAEAMAEIDLAHLAWVETAFTHGGGTYVLKEVAAAAVAFKKNSPEWQWIMANVRNDARWNAHYLGDPWLCVSPRG